MQRIYAYSISILLIISQIGVFAQSKKSEPKIEKTNWWNGMLVQMDAASLVGSALTYKESYSLESAVQFDLNQKYFPVVEAGIAGADKITSTGNNFQTNGVFSRVGVDFNLMNKSKDSKPTNNLFMVGARIGFTAFNYNINNIEIADEYWKTTETLNYRNQFASKVWFEIVAGIKVELTKNIFVGWTVRNKNMIGQSTEGDVSPFYIPGYGNDTNPNWGFSYTIGYKIL